MFRLKQELLKKQHEAEQRRKEEAAQKQRERELQKQREKVGISSINPALISLNKFHFVYRKKNSSVIWPLRKNRKSKKNLLSLSNLLLRSFWTWFNSNLPMQTSWSRKNEGGSRRARESQIEHDRYIARVQRKQLPDYTGKRRLYFE